MSVAQEEMIELKSSSQLDLMRQAGRIIGQVLEVLQEAVRPGISTLELDTLVEKRIRDLGGQPAFKGYQGFPASLCSSVNEQVVHGIPSDRRLNSGDVVGLDVGAIVHGYYSDAAITLPVGEISDEAERLLEVTENALAQGIAKACSGNRLSDISHAVQVAAESSGFSVVREFVGHGIGTQLHEAPQIPNFGESGFGPELKPGMVLAIEPMVNVGGAAVKILSDGWTAVTADSQLSAHFEHTVAITESGPEILTRCQKKKLSR